MFKFGKIFIVFVFLIFEFQRKSVYGFSPKSFTMRLNSENIYYLVAYIGTPSQRFHFKVTLFSSNFTIDCSKNEDIFLNQINKYYPNISSSSWPLYNSSELSQNNSLNDIYADSIIFENNLLIPNFTLICSKNTNDDKMGSLAIMNNIFYNEDFPYNQVCFHSKGGYMKPTNMTINDVYLQNLQLKSTNLIFNQSNDSFAINVKTFGLKQSNIITLFGTISPFYVRFENVQYHKFSSVLFKNISSFLYSNYFHKFQSFINDDSCFIIYNFADIKNQLPTFVFVLKNSDLLEFRLEDYLIFYSDQGIYCFSFRENIVDDLNILSMNFFNNRLLYTDFSTKTAKLIDLDCKNFEIENLINNYFDSSGKNNVDDIFINIFIAFACLMMFLCGLQTYIQIKKFLLKRQSQSSPQNKKQKHKKNVEIDQIKLEIIDKKKEVKKNTSKDKSLKYMEKQEEEIKENPKIEKEDNDGFKFFQESEKIDKTKLKEKFLKKNKKEKPEKNEKPKKKNPKKYFLFY